ncbi:HD family phosphohydrolase [Kyrpidia spormannii]|uniref:Metal-dependent phosphohydrolase n=2 Tax=Kyrpidia spormannii TaxID=2055160 RepID=A0A6F9E5I0_9BACL|nr:HDIG domain-containing metalloprotein [Kyrpidia spormannii]CAB3391211.1 Metal-dependent phosphohydrolase [Kyrpidia spormannii]CAB3392123.1 Metal-dependent phosphohydrolase [Kyrpidia spormannii]
MPMGSLAWPPAALPGSWKSSRGVRVLIYVVLGFILYGLFVGNTLPQKYSFQVGSISDVDIKAPTDAVDTLATQQRKDDAAAKVPKQYTVDPSVEDSALQDLSHLFSSVQELAGQTSLSPAQRFQQLKAAVPPGLQVSDDVLNSLLSLSPQELNTVRNETNRMVEQFLGREFGPEDLASAPSEVDRQLVGLDLSRNARLVIHNLTLASLRPNKLYDVKRTEELRQQARDSVPDVWIQKGEIVVRAGERITPEILSRLRDLNLLAEQPNYRLFLGFAVVIAGLVSALALYIERIQKKIVESNWLLVVLGLIVVIVALEVKGVSMISRQFDLTSLGYFVPVAVGSMLVTMLFDLSLAVFVSFLFSFFAAFGFDDSFAVQFVSLVGALAGAFAVARVKQRFVIVRAGFVVAIVDMIAIAAMRALFTGSEPGIYNFLRTLLLGLANGMFSAILTTGLLPFFESAFGLLTPMRLLELSNPNHPLLRKLLLEAPGTYHHSLIVGNLAEAAAEVVGADPLLCRVGAYYHDVGKAKRPAFFVENQMTRENPHDKIAPSLSHLIITSHVRDGLELQEQHRLPESIRDICAQHHGTTVLWYFYNKALEQDKSGTVSVDSFRYPGPKPRSKEAAVVMLCDAVEAAVRAMARPTPQRIEAVIRKIIRDRLQDGQLDESQLTLRDLDQVAEAFMRTLNGIYHPRIEYPEPPKASTKAESKGGAQG